MRDGRARAANEDELDAYARELEMRLRKLRTEGHILDVYPDLPAEARDRQRLLREKVDRAIAHGHFWGIVWAELQRDYGALFATLVGTSRSVDRDFMALAGHRDATRSRSDQQRDPE